jgi:ABC-type transport system involved in cytochrome c biogenesis permease subunit
MQPVRTRHFMGGFTGVLFSVAVVLCVMFLPAAAQTQEPGNHEEHDVHDHQHNHDHPAAVPATSHKTRDPHVWTPDEIRTFGSIPILSQGRIKPMSTYARFELVKLSGRASLRLKNDNGKTILKVNATEWLMDCLFQPEVAMEYKFIRVEDPRVMQAVGLPDTEKRTTFSFNQLVEVEDKMREAVLPVIEKHEDSKTPLDDHLLRLFSSYLDTVGLFQAFLFAQVPVPLDEDGLLQAILEPESREPVKHLYYSRLLEKMPELDKWIEHAGSDMTGFSVPPPEGIDLEKIMPILRELRTHMIDNLKVLGSRSLVLSMIPPASGDRETEWYSPGTMLQTWVEDGGVPVSSELDILRVLGELGRAEPGSEKFRSALDNTRKKISAMADSRGEVSKLGLEQWYYRVNFFQKALAFYLLAFILVALTWLLPSNRFLTRAAWLTTILPLLISIAGIVVRCIIRGRPPVSTLYETTLFIPTVAIMVALIGEWMQPRKIGLTIATVLGVLGMLLANIYELKDGADTMTRLVAVLNSNFWLSTHVITVVIGYSAGLLAAAIAHIYIFARVLNLNRDREFYRAVSGMVYGVVCFGALFSFVGTVLGGIWANYSWGRFWGWDPKENGALLIIIWFLIILHSRMGGYVRQLGICVLAVAGAIIVSFSWWGVNLLGVGLHSYGFTSGAREALNTFWAFESLVILLGGICWFIERHLRRKTGL